MIRSVLKFSLACLAALFLSNAALAQEHGTADEAVAMAKKAIAAIKADREKAYAAINDKNDKEFHMKDLYVFVSKTGAGCLLRMARTRA